MLLNVILRSKAANFLKPLKTPVFKKKISDIIKLSIGGTVVFAGINIYFKNEKFYNTWVMPLFHSLDPETAHNLAVTAAKYNLVPEAKLKESKLLDSPSASTISPAKCTQETTQAV